MFSLNRAMVIGNATKDPEMRYTPNGQAVASFAVATNRRWTNRETGELQEQVEFHDIVVWGKMAENASQYLKKGAPVYIEGRLQTKNWEGQDGVKRYRTEIVAENFILLGSRGGGNYEKSGTNEPSRVAPENPIEEVSKSDDTKSDADGKKSDEEKKPETEEIDIDEIPF
ncbi:MAG: single-stranded DNA-binding protein [Candidatus Berkelbacteria bacterium]|nr:single-stranded DNA-binding protein [Candidatus Berkelbacteria bacterium]